VKLRVSFLIGLFLLILAYYVALDTLRTFFASWPAELCLLIVILLIVAIYVLGRLGKLYGRVQL
jgi:hypothetical protein